MIRTQIQLPEDLYQRAKLVAKQREISLAEMTRRGLELFLARVVPPTVLPAGWELPTVHGGGIQVPLDRLHDLSAADESAAEDEARRGRSPRRARKR